MASGSKLNEALQVVLENLNETQSSDGDITAIEAENIQLRKRKADLMTKLSCHSTVHSSTILVRDMLSRQKTLNQTRMQAKEQAAIRCKNRAHEVAAQTAGWQEKFQQVDSLMTMSHNDVVKLISDMENKIAANRLKISELLVEHAEFSQNQEGSGDVLKLAETLKSVELEQSELLQKLKNTS